MPRRSSCSFYSFLPLLLVTITSLYTSSSPHSTPSMSTSTTTSFTSPRPAHLIIVMGTSGSGKSTLGSHLASALSLPFVDGDDLHPKANVEKMSRGEPLRDEDREGWLKRLRERAWEIVTEGDEKREEQKHLQQEQQQQQQQPGGSSTGVGLAEDEGTSTKQRLLAEVFETSAGQGVDTRREVEEIKAQAPTADQEETSKQSKPTISTTAGASSAPTSSLSSSHRAVVIACSALKKSYRSLLRGEIDSLPTSASASPSSSTNHPTPSELRTLHIYVEVTPEELLRRMHERKGHFMKESMLKSQLETLQRPVEGEEEGVIVLQDGRQEEVLQMAVGRTEEMIM
ncbi:carbohydrate kinase [Microstroma glucosiphilum]|uniref:gluconokinase n=1 Tax=Pseudomicrostroma glucosiphilum TaxID=1684307 RepID=A0A316U4J0_9BASI|nr:carbohydrate kinase [Pseudomicrostroma glucosiphilum]PWN19391.1 carbohydrate kinase [Pseudomicrostroma glucosiphilum]